MPTLYPGLKPLKVPKRARPIAVVPAGCVRVNAYERKMLNRPFKREAT